MAVNEDPSSRRRQEKERLSEEVGRREERRIRAKEEESRAVWFGLGMFGMVGWSVALPTLAGVALGIWIDRTWPGRFSWTLMLLLAGLIVGCFNAWFWVRKELERR